MNEKEKLLVKSVTKASRIGGAEKNSHLLHEVLQLKDGVDLEEARIWPSNGLQCKLVNGIANANGNDPSVVHILPEVNK